MKRDKQKEEKGERGRGRVKDGKTGEINEEKVKEKRKDTREREKAAYNYRFHLPLLTLSLITATTMEILTILFKVLILRNASESLHLYKASLHSTQPVSYCVLSSKHSKPLYGFCSFLPPQKS